MYAIKYKERILTGSNVFTETFKSDVKLQALSYICLGKKGCLYFVIKMQYKEQRPTWASGASLSLWQSVPVNAFTSLWLVAVITGIGVIFAEVHRLNFV